MKNVKIILLGLFAMLITACGGVYSVSGGKPDECQISFVAEKAINLSVSVDEDKYKVAAVKQKTYRRDRKFKKTAQNTISVKPGQHKVVVFDELGNQIYEHIVFMSANEHKVIQL